MSGEDGVLLTMASAIKLKRALEQELLAAMNLRSRLANEGARHHQIYAPTLPVQFVNNASETAPAYGVMRVTGVNSAGRVEVAKPNTTFQRLYLVNGHKDVAAGGTGKGTWLTEFGHGKQFKYVLYDTGNTPAYGEGWGPQDGTWTLKKGRWGFTIIGGNAGSGSTSRTTAIQHPVNHLLGKTNASHAKSASGTINLYAGTLGSETQVTSMTVTAYNRFAAVASGKWVHCSWVNGGWDLSAAECA